MKEIRKIRKYVCVEEEKEVEVKYYIRAEGQDGFYYEIVDNKYFETRQEAEQYLKEYENNYKGYFSIGEKIFEA